MIKNTCHIPCILQRTALGLISTFAIYGQAQVQMSGHIADQASGAPIAGLAIGRCSLVPFSGIIRS
jgi:hypothetical protein